MTGSIPKIDDVLNLPVGSEPGGEMNGKVTILAAGDPIVVQSQCGASLLLELIRVRNRRLGTHGVNPRDLDLLGEQPAVTTLLGIPEQGPDLTLVWIGPVDRRQSCFSFT